MEQRPAAHRPKSQAEGAGGGFHLGDAQDSNDGESRENEAGEVGDANGHLSGPSGLVGSASPRSDVQMNTRRRLKRLVEVVS